jgi:hypothetical protein
LHLAAAQPGTASSALWLYELMGNTLGKERCGTLNPSMAAIAVTLDSAACLPAAMSCNMQQMSAPGLRLFVH